jgi:pyruvate formate lyase activating enzyme
MESRDVELYERQADDTVRCTVCPRRCVIPTGKRGFCGVRENRDGRLVLTVYGEAVASHVDPIEKKPLFHVAPGARVLSIATRGCNFACDFCQNYRIALEHEGVRGESLPPERLVERVGREDLDGLAFTYTEPTIFLEYALDTMRQSPGDSLNVFVSNGYMTREAADLVGPHLDAINVDLKGDADFYRRRCSVPDPEPIYDALERLAAHDVFVEVTNLVIPGENDDEETVRERIRWIRDHLGADTPVHFSRFHPDYRMRDVPPTPIETLERLMDVARDEGMRYVYCGNVPGHESETTYCPDCGDPVIVREGFAVREKHLGPDHTCANCGATIPLRGDPVG